MKQKKEEINRVSIGVKSKKVKTMIRVRPELKLELRLGSKL